MIRRILPAALALALLIGTACSAQPTATRVPTKTLPPTTVPEGAKIASTVPEPARSPTPLPAAGASTLTIDALKNAEYSLTYTKTGKAPLKNGEYEEAAAPGSASKIKIVLSDFLASGDLTGDKADDAAAIMVSQTGGSGTFYDLVVVQNQNGKAVHVATIGLGDRIKITSIKVYDGRVTVTYLTRKDSEPMSAAPAVDVSKTFALQGGKLVEVK